MLNLLPLKITSINNIKQVVEINKTSSQDK